MRDVELYRLLLGIEAPWEVQSVDLSVADQKVDVMVGHAKRVRWPCPECGTELSVYDHAEERAWRHLDSCGFITWLHARPPRVSCPAHGVRQVLLPWAEPHARFTTLFERFAIDVLTETDITGACKILEISWDEGWHLIQRAVARGMARKERRVPTLIGVDEKAAAKGQRYLTLVCDLERATVEYIADERKQASLDGYFEALSEDERAQIKAVAMDMWEPYINSARANLEDADEKIVFDRYHLMKYLTTAVDTVRKQENGPWPLAVTSGWLARSTCGCIQRRTCPPATSTASQGCAPVTSRPLEPGRSRKACVTSGPTSAAAGRRSTSSAGTSGPPTRGSSPSSTRPGPSSATKRGCCPTSPTASATPAPRA